MKVAPSLSELRQGIKCMKTKEIIIYKIVLDIMGSYLRLFYGVSSKKYSQKYLPTVISFYKIVDSQKLGEVMQTLMESLNQLPKNE
jgi:hypothetical protein